MTTCPVGSEFIFYKLHIRNGGTWIEKIRGTVIKKHGPIDIITRIDGDMQFCIKGWAKFGFEEDAIGGIEDAINRIHLAEFPYGRFSL